MKLNRAAAGGLRAGALILFISALLLASLRPARGQGPLDSPARARPKFVSARTAPGVTAREGEYLVHLSDTVAREEAGSIARSLAVKYGGEVTAVMRDAVRAFLLRRISEPAARLLSEDELVQSVEQDSVVRFFPPRRESGAETALSPGEVSPPLASEQNNNPFWSLDRIDQRDGSLDRKSVWSNKASGVRLYILDTGVRATHQEIRPRVIGHQSFVGDTFPADTDCNGHGTAVASVAAGISLGQAREAQIVSVKVLDCAGYGSPATMLQGIDWIKGNLVTPAVVLVGAAFSDDDSGISTLEAGINSLIEAGATVVVPGGDAVDAGSQGPDSRDRSPCQMDRVICVASTTDANQRARSSAYGQALTLLAPGECVPTAGSLTDFLYYNCSSGTPLAASVTAGVALQYLFKNPQAQPEKVKQALIRTATAGEIDRASLGDRTPNRLLYCRFDMSAVRNAAHYGATIARDSLAVAFVDRVTKLDKLEVEDERGSFQAVAPLPTPAAGGLQINFLVPPGVSDDYRQANVSLTGAFGQGCSTPDPKSCGENGAATVWVSRVAPALFTANSQGHGLASGQLLRVNRANPTQRTYEFLRPGGNVLNVEVEDYFLVLYGTGFRHRRNLADVVVRVAGVPLPVTYAGPTPGIQGLDQINVQVPSSFTGRGLMEIDWTVEEIPTNKVQVHLR